MKFPATAVLTLSVLLTALPAGAKTKPKAKAPPAPAAAAAPDCPRASYKGDPVCFGEYDGKELPTPSAGAVPREKSTDVRINDQVSITGADPKAMSKQPVYINNPSPNPRKQDIGGAAGVNYKF